MEIVAILARWSQLVANLILLGSCLYLAVAGGRRELFSNAWVVRLERLFPTLAAIVLFGLIGVLATTTGKATGIESNTWKPGAWIEIVQHTSMGHMWALRAISALFLMAVAVFIYLKRERARWHYIVGTCIASLPLVASTIVSHAGADENSILYVPVYAIHILMAGAWFGALPAFLLIVFDRHNCDAKGIQLVLNIDSLKRFSAIALPIMVAIILTGLVLTDRMVEEDYHALVASTYGWVLVTKIALLITVLFIAYQARLKWLPSFERVCDSVDRSSLDLNKEEKTISQSLFSKWMHKTVQVENHDCVEDTSDSGVARLRKWVRVEFVLALLLVLFATILSNSVPAKHAMVENWPYPFRFTIDGSIGAGSWRDPTVQFFLGLGVILLVAAFGLFGLSKKKGWNFRKRVLVTSTLAVSGIAVILPQFAVDAYPETYRNTPVPFDAISISNGSIHFSEFCSSCHGPQGKGNGILAKTLPMPPADLLTEPHTARHTAGDFFHWLGYGIKNTGMPGFINSLSEEDRWDTVNYIHAMSRGYQARLLSPAVVPDKPSMGPPVFQFTAYDGTAGTLKDFRQTSNVLLVFFGWPNSQDRLKELNENYEELKKLNTVVLAVPLDGNSEAAVADFAADTSLEVIQDGWFEIKNSYALYRRTLKYPDILGQGNIPDHMEFLVDRFGYLRARWIPSLDQSGWSDLNLLTSQLRQLNQEKEILPPPGDHVH